METPCLLVDLLASGSCFDFWLNRYQTLLTGLIAVSVALLQIRLSYRQASIIETQEAIVAKQQDITEAQAQARVREGLSTVGYLQHWTLSHMAGNTGAWSVNGVPNVQVSSVDSDIVAIGYPERTEEIMAAFKAAENLNAVYQRYIKEPWPVQFPGDEQAKIDAAPRIEEAEKALQAFGTAFAKVRDLALI